MTKHINPKEIEHLINSNENSKVDFKKEWYASTNKNNCEIVKDFIALANGNIFSIGYYGYLIIGVEEKKTGEKILHDIQVVQDIAIVKRQILQNLKNYVTPRFIDFEIDYVIVKNKTLLIIKIPQHPYLLKLKKAIKKNYYREGDILYRAGESTEVAPFELATKHEQALEMYVSSNNSRSTLSVINVKDEDRHKEVNESKNYNLVKKICLINIGGFGMTSIAAGILRPKHPSTRILQIYGINTFLRVANSSIIPIREIEKIFEIIINEDELIVDIASIVALDFMDRLADYKGTANDFDRYVIPTESSQYSFEKTVYTVKKLFSLGVLAKEIRIIFNMNKASEENVVKAFSKTIEELEKIGIKCNTSAFLPISSSYFERFYTSDTRNKKIGSDSDAKDLYELKADGTDGSILHQRARESLSKCFFEINEYIYK